MRAAAAFASARRAGQRARSARRCLAGQYGVEPATAFETQRRPIGHPPMPASARRAMSPTSTTAARSPAPAAHLPHRLHQPLGARRDVDGVVRRSRSVTPSIDRASGERSAVASLPSNRRRAVSRARERHDAPAVARSRCRPGSCRIARVAAVQARHRAVEQRGDRRNMSAFAETAAMATSNPSMAISRARTPLETTASGGDWTCSSSARALKVSSSSAATKVSAPAANSNGAMNQPPRTSP